MILYINGVILDELNFIDCCLPTAIELYVLSVPLFALHIIVMDTSING